MDVEQQYLPAVPERITFIKNRIDEYKRQVFGGTLEIKMAEKNGEKRNIVTTKDMIEQIINNINVLEEELNTLV